MNYIQTIAIASVMFMGFCLRTDAEPIVGGRTADQEFADPKVAALVRAACSGDEDAVSLALRDGAALEGKGRWGETPLFWALKCDSAKGVEALLKRKANPNARIPGQFTAVWAASGMYNPLLLKLLLQYGGDPNAADGDDSPRTALSSALNIGIGGHGWDNYYALLNAGADINRSTTAGETIVTDAAVFHAYDKVEELLNRGYKGDLVDLSIRLHTRRGDTGLAPDIAAAKARVVAILRQRGVSFPPIFDSVVGRVWMDRDRKLTVFLWGKQEKPGMTKPSEQIVRPGEPSYKDIILRVHDLEPFQSRLILRNP